MHYFLVLGALFFFLFHETIIFLLFFNELKKEINSDHF